MARFCGTYRMDGADWGFTIDADSHEDAARRLAHIKAWGRIDGELMMVIPAITKSPWLPDLICRIVNALRAA